jgi:hypothetical protein
MPYSGMLRHVGLVRTNVSGEPSASIIIVTAVKTSDLTYLWGSTVRYGDRSALFFTFLRRINYLLFTLLNYITNPACLWSNCVVINELLLGKNIEVICYRLLQTIMRPFYWKA